MYRPLDSQGDGLHGVGRVGGARSGVEHLLALEEGNTTSAIQVVVGGARGGRTVWVAQALGEQGLLLRPGGGGAPSEIFAVSQQDVLGDPREGRALGIDPAAVEVLLEQDLRRVVVNLRAGHEQRMP